MLRLRSLRTRLLVTLLASLAVPFVLFGFFAWVQMSQRLERDIVSMFLRRVAEETAWRLEQTLREREQDLRVWVASPQVRDALAGRGHGGLARLLDLAPAGVYQLVLLADAEGRVVFQRTSQALVGAERLEELEALAPASVAGEDWFQELARTGGILRGDRHRSPYLHRAADAPSLNPSDFSVALGAAVVGDAGEVEGALLCLVDWSAVQGVLDEVARYFQETREYPSGYAFLFASDADHILAHHHRENYNTSLRRDHGLPQLAGAVRASAAEGGTGQDTLGYEYPPGTPKISAWQQVALPHPLDWFVGVGIDNADIFRTSNVFRDVVLAAIALVVLAVVGWSWFVSRQVLRPVRALQAATGALASGEAAARVPADQAARPDELGDLARAFNRMAEELERSSEELRRAEREAAWAHMARQVAHEIKNPLTPMRLSAQMLEKALEQGSPGLEEIGRRTVRAILTQVEALRRIASDFSLLAGRMGRQKGPVDADELLASVGELYAAGGGQGAVPVRVEAASAGAIVLADAGDLRRALINLVNNSMDAIAEAGGQGEVVLRSRRNGAWVELAVEDDGPGIPDDAREHLFEPYFSTRSHGTGLGLAIVKRTAEAYGGRVEIAPQEGGGTRAVLRLPCRQDGEA